MLVNSTVGDRPSQHLSSNTQDTSIATDKMSSIPTLITSVVLIVAIVIIMLLGAILTFLSGNEKKNSLKNGRLLLKAHQQTTVDYSKKYVLVTGCDRGLGNAMARKLDNHGFSVIAGCLNVKSDSVTQLQQESSERLQAVQLDVTSEDDRNAVKSWIGERLNGELWGVVNNAGVCMVGTPEIMSERDISAVIDVNYLGTVNITRKFLPFIRRSRGRIVNIGSINGEVPMPFFSIYNSTKAAVKSFTESLSYELKDWGVKASLIAPAGFKTDIIRYDRTACADKWWAEASDDVRDDYGKDYFAMPMRESRRMKLSDDFTPVTDSVVDALTSDSPLPVYRVGAGSSLIPALYKFTPNYFKNYLCGSMLNFISSRPLKLQTQDQV